MSNALAIASVTQALALLIENNLRPEIDMAVSVETRKPPAEPPTEPTITVFLYHVAPNPSMRNTDLPSRTSNGALVARPTAALDLHYLISAYGEEAELVGQRLIGCVVRTLQEMPVLPRDLIEQAATRPYLAGSDLAESPQKVRFSPIQMDTDETSKLWGMLHQTPYSLSVTYQGSLVFIDGREQPVPPKPVEHVNPTVRPFTPVPEPVAPQVNPDDVDVSEEASESPDAAPERPKATATSPATRAAGTTTSGAKRPDSSAVKSAAAKGTPVKSTTAKSAAAKGTAAKSSAAKTPPAKPSAAKGPAGKTSSARRTAPAADQPTKTATSSRKSPPNRSTTRPSTSEETGGATRAGDDGQD
ncbi:DUF4255 domain-containing protein [Saccharopolyspora gloriosae]|uniref:DUF4255 domain-containing protein n=1 Tax=Saccharopolyspora gloriosae TaxID=455344 RepID=UPI001FB685B1|nr:DUF4255 domain-containing protein [Saccharopolyspora gloriosae]